MRPPVPRSLRLVRLLMLVSAGITALMVLAGLLVLWDGWATLGAMTWLALPGALQLVFALRLPTGRRGLFWAIVVLHALLVVLALANLAAGMVQGATQAAIPVLVLVGLTRPAARAHFASPSPAGPRRSGRGLLRRIHDPDRGAGFTEYAAVIVLVAAITAAVAVTDIGAQVRTGISDSVDAILNGGDTGGGSGGDGPTGTGGDTTEGSGTTTGGDTTEGSGTTTGGDTTEGSGTTTGGGDGDDAGAIPVSHTADGGGGGGGGGGGDGGGKSVLRHVGDFFGGVWDGVSGDVEGVIDIFTTNPVDTVKGMWDGITQDPLSLLISPEARDAWQNGDYGESLGLGTWDIGSWFIPGAGWAAKGGKLGRLGKLGRVDTPDTPNPRPDADGNKKPDSDKERGKPDCRRNSFVPGTLVLMADGSYAAVEEITVGDRVHAFDPVSAAEGPREVTALVFGDGQKTLVDITVVDADGQGGVVTTTAEHPFWLPAEARWGNAVDLEPGQWLRTSAGTWTRVDAVQARVVSDQRVHNFTVQGLHTYYVAVNGVETLVHNDGCAPVRDIVTDKNGDLIGWEDSKGVRIVTQQEIQDVRTRLHEEYGEPVVREIPGKGTIEVWEVEGGKINYRSFSSSGGANDPTIDFSGFPDLGMKRLHTKE